MRHLISCILVLAFLFTACNQISKEKEMTDNIFLGEWNTPYGVPPFDLIKNENYLPAYKKAIKIHNQEIIEIVESEEVPSFENTIAALDASGELLRRVDNVFENVNEAHTNSELIFHS